MLDFSVTFVITIVNIAILFFVLRALLFRRVSAFMAERAGRVRDSIEQAAAEKARARELLEQCREKLKGAEAEAEGIIRAAREKAGEQAGRIVAEGKAEARALVEDARRQTELERQRMVARFGAEAAALVMAASSRLVRREFSGDDSRRYAGMLLDELAGREGKG